MTIFPPAVDPYAGTIQPTQRDTLQILLLKLAAQFYALMTGGAALSVSSQPLTVAPNFAALGASATQVIPAGAKGYTIIILTGTATINGQTAPAGVSVGSSNIQSGTVTVTTAAASSAFVAWEV